MKKLFLLLGVIVFISCTSAEKYHSQAKKFENKGNYEQAIYYLDKAISKNPKLIDAYLDRGVDKSILGDYNGAINDYSSVIRLDSTNVLAYYNRAKNYNRISQYQKAYSDITKAFNLTTKYRLQNLYISFTDDKYAVEMEEIVFERGITFFHMDSLNHALSDLNYSVENNEVEAYYWRGLTFIKMNDLDRGCEDLKKASSLNLMDAERAYLKYCYNQTSVTE